MSIFNKISIKKPGYSTFDLSHEKKLSMKMGNLTPIFLQEVVPGDRFRVSSETFIRMAPMIAPIMHRVNVFVHYFFVPNRLVWDEWETFITDIENPPILPKHTHLASKGSLADYYGLPVSDGTDNPVYASSLPFRGYQEIFNEYYRDQNLQEKIDYFKGSGLVDPNPGRLTAMRVRAWEKDYFTSALPWAQKGPDVNLPMDFDVNYKSQGEIIDSLGNPGDPTANAPINAVGDGPFFAVNGVNGPINIDNIESIESNVTINELRRSTRVQEWLEKQARGGSRYAEVILSHFGVKSADARLQRPEYLGGGKAPVVISEVLNTSATTDAPQGNMSGHGISIGNTNQFRARFTEHGYIHGIMSVIPRTTYQQGTPRHMLKDHPFDFYFPSFAQLGEQEITQDEIYHRFNGEPNSKDIFGYQQRYAEYKYQCSTVHGDFKDNLNHWHMGRIFENEPQLNSEFVRAEPTDRIFAVNDESDKLFVQIYNNVKAIRPMPYYGIPTL